MAASDREVFRHFIDNPDLPREVALIAYASYAAEKYDWIAHVELREGEPPSGNRIDSWISDLPDSRLATLRDTALAAFDIAATAYMEPILETAKKEAVDSSILQEVKKATSFRSTFGPNLVIGVVASFAFALLIYAAQLIWTHDPSPVALLKQLHP